ncbi:MAG: DUF4430 domain-containing protein [Candidatus Desulforudis sp.]|nr:DUF4430 domain-containing protein [Desulforudis sp.]
MRKVLVAVLCVFALFLSSCTGGSPETGGHRDRPLSGEDQVLQSWDGDVTGDDPGVDPEKGWTEAGSVTPGADDEGEPGQLDTGDKGFGPNASRLEQSAESGGPLPRVSGPASGAGDRVFLHVTQEYGRKALFSREVGLESGDTVLDILKRHLDVQTAYGGAFVSGLDGLISGYAGRTAGRESKDWLYWVNGVAAAVGPAQYRPGSGDFIWWDYQDWGAAQMATAVVGAFPQPFVNSYGSAAGGGLILYAPGYAAEAKRLEALLRECGVTDLRAAPLNLDLVEGRECPTLVVGAWEELSALAVLARFNDRGLRSGFYLRFVPGGIVRLNTEGREVGRYGAGTGAFWAAGAGPGDRAPLFVVTGTDRAGVTEAVELLVQEPTRCRGAFALVMAPGAVVPVP